MKKRILSAVLALTMVFTLIPATAVTALAAEGEQPMLTSDVSPEQPAQAAVILSFDALALTEYEAAFGTARDDIGLPDTLAASIEGEDGESVAAAVNVTWNGDYEAKQAGAYSLSAYAEGYTLSEGVTWPSVTVTVLPGEAEPVGEPTPEPTEEPTPEPTEEPTPEPTEEPTPEPTEEPTPEPDEIDLLIAAIDALPEIDYSDVDMEDEEAFAAWLDEQYAVYAEVPPLYEQLTLYADDTAAMERIGAERADKLTGLYTMLFGAAVTAEASDDTMLLGAALTTDASDNWTNYAASGYAGGSGTSGDPYIINTPEQLAYLSQQANDITDYSGKYFKLGANIDLSAHYWTPIGHDDRKFKGNFDGANYTIYGMNIVTASTVNPSNKWLNVGFFGRTESGATIKNINITSAVIDVDQTYDRTMNVGGIGGFLPNNEVTNCSFNGTISARYSCSVIVSTSNIYVGGIVGRTSDSITAYGSNFTDCAAFGSITASSPTVYECLIGGIGGETSWGSTRGKMENCYANSVLTNTAYCRNKPYFGGVVGYTNMKASAKMYYRYSDSTGNAFGAIYYSSGLEQADATHLGSDGEMKAAMIDGLSWDQSDDVNDGYPIPSTLYDVTYDLRGGSGATAGKAAFGYPLVLPAEPAREGYTFTGWYDAASGGTQYTGEVYLRSEGLALYAHWSCNHAYDNACDTVCNTCGEVRSITHTAVTDPAVAPTCTTAGKTVGSHCSVCKEVLTAQQTVAKLGHNYLASVTAPTCTEQGYTTYTCSRGDSRYIDNYVDALGHTAVTDPAVAPTCTTAGKTEGSHCSVCDEILTAQTAVPATGHTAVTDPAVAPTCTTAGKTVGSHCSVCDEILTAQKIVPATGHTAVTDPAVAPTCTAAGKTEGSHCSVCDEILTAQTAVPATGHTAVTDPAVAPTCTAAGKTEGSHCSVCDEILTAQTAVPATGHSWGAWESNGNGTETRVCTYDPSHKDTRNSAYSVTLNANGGTVGSGNVTGYTFGTGAALPAAVTKTGYAFGGWYADDSFTGSPVTAIAKTDTGSKTYYAKWALDAPAVVLAADVSDVTYGASVTLTATASHALTSGVSYSYEWYKDNNKISGSAEALTLSEVSDSGSYTVKVTASDGTLTSAAAESGAASVTISAAAHDKPGAPSFVSKTYNSITVTAVDGQKYLCQPATAAAPTGTATGWSATGSFTGLSPNTAYEIYTYKTAADGNHTASPVSAALAITTSKVKITSVTAPGDTTLADYYATGDTAKAELAEAAASAAEDGTAPSLPITWAAPQTYNAAPGETNSFSWSVSAPADYEFAADAVSSGSATVTNKAATEVSITGADKEATYDGGTYDVSLMFSIPDAAGAASYSIVTGGSGAGTLSGSTLTITKAGTISIKAATAPKGNYAAGEQTAALTVNKGSVAVPAIAAKAYTGQLLTADITGSNADNGYAVTTNGGGIGAGSYNVVLTLNKPDLYKWNGVTPTAEKRLTFTISQAANGWKTALACAGFTYDGTKTLAPAAQAKFGTAGFTYAMDPGGQYAELPEGGIKDAGIYYIKATVDGNANYTGLAAGPVAVTIGKVKLTPSVSSVTAREYNGGTGAAGTISLAAADGYAMPANETPTASGAFAWTGADAGTATVDVTDIELTDAGVNKNYELDAVSLTSITAPGGVKISPRALDISARSLIYNGTTACEAENCATGVNSETITLTYTLTAKDVGAYTFGKAGNGFTLALSDTNYSVKSAGTLTIAPKPLTAPAKTVIYNGGESFTQEVDGADGEKVAITYTAHSKSVGGYAFSTEAGTGKYTAAAGDANYTVTGGGALTIGPLTAVLAWSGDGESTYNGRARSVTAEISNKVTDDAVSVTVSGGTKTNASATAYTATASGLAGDDAENYKLPASPVTAYTIKPKSISGAAVTLGAALTYNGGEQTQEVARVTIDGLDATFGVSGNKQTSAKSDYTLTVAGSGNFNGTQTAEWGIAKRALSITAKPQTITYGQSITTGTGQVEASGLADGDELDSIALTPSGDQVAGDKAITPGAAVIKRGEATVTSNYNITRSAGVLTIEPAVIAPGASGADVTYDGSPHAITVAPVTVNGQTASVTYKTGAASGFGAVNPGFTDAGEYTVYYKITAPNHADRTGSSTVKISTKALTADMIGPIASPTYDGGAQTPAPPVSWTPGGESPLTLTAGRDEDFTFSYANNTNAALSSAAKNAPTVTITAVEGGNYSGSAYKAFTIRPLTAELAWSGYTGLVYDGKDKTVTASVSNKAPSDSDEDLPLVYRDNVQKNAGDYKAAVTSLGNANYALPSGPTLDFTIAKAPISFTVSGNEYTYDAQRHAAAVTQTVEQTPAIAGDKFSISYQPSGGAAASGQTDAGEYAITVALTDDNFCFSDERDEDIRSHTLAEKLTIGKKPVTAQWKNLIHVYDGEDKTPVFVIDDGDVFSADSGEVRAELGANAKADAGTYTVTASLTGSRAANYELTNPIGSLIIQKAPVTFTVSDNSVQHDGSPHLATVTATVGGGSFTDFTVSYKNAKDETVAAPTDAGGYGIYGAITDPNCRHADSAYGTARKIGVLTIYKAAPPAVYTVSFDVGGGTAIPPMAQAQAGTERILPPCSDGDKIFRGWQYQGKLYQPGAAFIQPEANITLKALWADRTYSVGGAVDENGDPLQNVVVTLMLGSQQIAQTVTDADGKYHFSGVLPGIYNLAAHKGGVTQTILVVIRDTGVEDQAITMPDGKLSSVVEVTAGTPAVVVGNLEKAFTPEDVQAAGDAYVELKLTADERAADSGEEQEAISRQDSAVGLYLELTLTRTVDGGTPETLADSPVLLTAVITLPGDLQGKDRYTVYRMHDGELQTLTATPNAEGEKIVVNADKTALTVYTKNFSAYAVSGANRRATEYPAPMLGESPARTEAAEPTAPAADEPAAPADASAPAESPVKPAAPAAPAGRTEAALDKGAPLPDVSAPAEGPLEPDAPAAPADGAEAAQTDDVPEGGADAPSFALSGAALATLFLLILFGRRKKKDEETGRA